MRSIVVCTGLVVAVLAAGCGKEPQDTGPKLPVPQCANAGDYDKQSFAKLVASMDRLGDIAEVERRFAQHKVTLETLLGKRHPQLMPRLKPVLDAQFAGPRLRERAACLFAGLSAQREGVAALDAWSRRPEMRAIDTAIWTRKPVASEEDDVAMTAERKGLLQRIAAAMALQRIQASNDAVAHSEAAALAAMFDSMPPTAAPTKAAQPDITIVVDRWLAPVLVKVPDEDLVDFLKFIESTFGSDYYVALNSAFDFRTGEWYARLADLFAQNNVKTAQAGHPGMEALIADARRSLREIDTPALAADAMGKLLQAERIDPGNAEVKMLLGEAAIKTAPPMPVSGEQLRVVIQTPNYEQADAYLAKAIELKPDLADAHVLLGRLRYLQGRDDEAAAALKHAGELDPNHPALDLYRGDLAYAKLDYAAASNHFQAALNRPEGLAHIHANALNRMLVVVRKTGRTSDYQKMVDKYLARRPDAWNVRLDFADFLLIDGARADRVLAVIEPVPDTWFPARKIPTLASALVRKSGDHLDKYYQPAGESQVALRRALALSPDPRVLADAVCRSGVKDSLAKVVINASPAPKAVATAAVVCALRWRNAEVAHAVAGLADAAALSRPLPELNNESPLCYAAATRNVKGFMALAKLQVQPGQRCADGDSISDRLQRMRLGNDSEVSQMIEAMKRYYRKA